MNPLVTMLAETSPDSWPPATGGRHRTCQIHELINDAGIAIEFIPPEKPCLNLWKYWLGAQYFLHTGWKHQAPLRSIRRCGGVVARASDALRDHSGQKILLWEVTHPNNLPLAHLARRAGYSLVIAPQNLDSLTPTGKPVSSARIGMRVAAEVRALTQGSAIFTISREEQWLLALHGLAADHLPYYPPSDLEKSLLALRERRANNSNPDRFLVLGSFGNFPTAQGMIELINMLQKLPQGSVLPVDIAGAGTEALQPHLRGVQYRLHGTVNQNTLSDLMARARALLLYQSAAVGALTRIPEALVAGVPVIANPIAARNATHVPGVHVYDSATQLHELLQRSLATPSVPAKPTRAAERFIKTLSDLINR